MSTVGTLVRAFLREHPSRVVLTTLATASSVALVIWVAGSYDALLKTFDEFANRALGHYVLSVAPIARSAGGVPNDAIAALRADPAVAGVEPMAVLQIPLRPLGWVPEARPEMGGGRPGRGPGPGRGGLRSLSRMETPVVATDSVESPFPILRGRWLDGANQGSNEVVLGQAMAERWALEVGEEVRVGTDEHGLVCVVVGVMETPEASGVGGQILAPGVGGAFVSRAAAERLQGQAVEAGFVGVALHTGADITRFRFGWAPKLSRFQPPLQFQEAYEIEEALDESAAADNVRLQGYAATGTALLIALLVIFSTLNMGVTERIRQFAVLRAVALTKVQVGQLILLESLALGLMGLIGGVLVGGALVHLAAHASSALFRHGASVGPHGLGLAALASLGGALLGAWVPVHRATRVRPVDALGQRPAELRTRRGTWMVVMAGVLLVAVNPLMAFVFPPTFDHGIGLALALGFISLATGLVLAAPLAVVVVDRVIGPLLARLLVIDPRLVASQITSHLWRSVGAAISLTVGLGLYIAVQVWGFTMLEGFIPGRWAPDALLSFRTNPISLDEARGAASLPGVDGARCYPIVVEQPRLLEDLTHSAERASITRQDNVVIVGVDDRAWRGLDPMLSFEWVQGSPEEAAPLMRAGRGCVVPDHFLRETGLKMGDAFTLVPPEHPDHPVSYTIAGAVRLPGWHWLTKQSGFRTRTHRAAALVFADFETVARDFSLPTVKHIWFDQAAGADARQLEAAAQARFVERPAEGADASTPSPGLRVVTTEGIREMTRNSAKQWIWIISQLPLVALVIACFGVLNVMLASVRARRWEMGVLRAVGFTRGALARAVLAEGLMIGATACLLSLGFGVLTGWCGAGYAQYFSFFGGMHPSLVVPGPALLVGLLAGLALTALTAAWPAFSIARTKPLSLLQAGRGNF